jgi:predicted SAM-dependent methyltransferase
MPISTDTFDPEQHPRKLNLGCGNDIRPGYLNIDVNAFQGPDLVADVSDPAFLPSEYYEEIVAQDVLEHLPRTDTLSVLQRWNRVLLPGGRLILRVPSIEALAALLQRPENASPARQEELIQCLFGTQAYTGDFHYTSFTRILLRHYLEQAGFELESLEVTSGWLFDATARKAGHLAAPTSPDFAELLSIPGDEAFLHACYREILGREADAGGMAYWQQGLAGGGMVRDNVVKAMLSSDEHRARRARR